MKLRRVRFRYLRSETDLVSALSITLRKQPVQRLRIIEGAVRGRGKRRHTVVKFESWPTHGARFLQRPARALLILLAVVLGVELAQYVPEAFPGAHALGEVVRNLAYALIGAVVFHWLIVEIPARGLRRSTYEFHRMTFQTLLVAGPGLLRMYQDVAEHLGEDLNIWEAPSLARMARKIDASAPDLAFGPARVSLLQPTVEIAIPRALADLSSSAAYLEPEVAHALSQFPRQDGITILQVRRTASGGVQPEQDAHITWSLLEAARWLYLALLQSGAYDSSIFQGSVGNPPSKLTPDVLIKEKTSGVSHSRG